MEYSWLSDIVDFDNCSAEKITVYRSGGYIYLLVEGSQSSILYNANGLTYCTNSPSYDCQAFYTVDEEIAVWNCGDEEPTPVDNDMDGSFSDIDPNDNDPCIPNNTVSNCDTTSNTIGSDPPGFLSTYPWLSDLVDFETCTSEKITVYTSAGYTYLFVETPQNAVLYNADGLRYCTNSPTYDCQAFYSVDEVNAIWSCGDSGPILIPVDGDGDGLTDDIDPDDMDACNPDPTTSLCLLESGTLPPFFEQYPWLADIVNPFDCGTAKVTVYQSSGYNYLLVENGSFPVLYNTTGLRYCSNSSNYNCQDFYTVDEVIEVWECGNSLDTDQNNSIIDLSIATPLDTQFSLFPNPTKGFVSIQWDQKVEVVGIQVLTIQGQLIQSITNTPYPIELNLSGQQEGIYLVKVLTEMGSITKKILVH